MATLKLRTYVHPEVEALAQLFLAARQARGVNLPNWSHLSEHDRMALLLDAEYVLKVRGVIAPTTTAEAA